MLRTLLIDATFVEQLLETLVVVLICLTCRVLLALIYNALKNIEKAVVAYRIVLTWARKI